MLRRRALVAGLASLTAACAGPASRPTPLAEAPAQPAPTLAPPGAVPAPPPTATPATPTALPSLNRAPRSATARPLEPRPTEVAPDRVALADTPAAARTVEQVAPPPLASLAIMIENQADARPQTGLTQADVVYEALAEGGITRFIALFITGDAPVVGPVRSLRHYFAFMAADYGADVVHIGASPEGFAWRDAMNMGHLDESAGDPGVWRIRARPPPHNAYTDTAADRGFLEQRGRQQNHQWGPLRFGAQAPLGGAAAEAISLGFAPWAYRVGYTWDASQERYLRFMEGRAHRDAASGEQIAPASVVVQFADVEPIANDDKLRLDVNLVGGSGPLVVFSAGTRREGTWSKSAPRTSTVWLDDTGERLMLPPGPVWVEVVPLDSPVSSA